MMQEVLLVASVAIGPFILIKIVLGIFRKKPGDQLFQPVECFNCGWRGRVSRYAGRCPQCNQPLGE